MSTRISRNLNRTRTGALLAVAVLGLSAFSHQAFADQTKADNTDALSLTTSWVGGVVPTGDIAVWDSTVTAANSVALGGDLSLAGIKIINPGGLVTLTAGNLLTLGASGIDMSAATQSLTIATGTTLGAAQTWNVAQTLTQSATLNLNSNILTIQGATGTTVISGIVTGGAGGIVKNDAGTLNLSGNSTFTGGVTLNDGVVNVTGSGNAVGTGTLKLNGGTLTVANNLTIAAPVQITGTTTINEASVAIFNQNFTGAGTLNWNIGNGGRLDLGNGGNVGNFTGFTGTLNFNVPTGTASVRIQGSSSGSNADVGLGNATVNLGTGNLTLNPRNGGNQSIGALLGGAATTLSSGSGAISYNIGNLNTSTTFSGGIRNGTGAVGVNKVGTGVLTLNGTNHSYTGVLNVQNGVLEASNNLALGAATASTNLALGTVSTTGTLRYLGAAANSGRSLQVNGAGVIEASGSGPLTFTNAAAATYGTVDIPRTLTLTGSNTGNNTLTASMSNNGIGAVSLIKDGVGSWVLAGTNSNLAGGITVSNGSLSFNPAATATLTAGSINVATGAALGAGAFGTFSTSNLTLAANSILNFNFNAIPAANGSFNILGGGSLTINGAVGVNVTSGGSLFANNGNYPVITNITTGNFVGAANNLSVINGGTASGNFQFVLVNNTLGTSDIVLQVSGLTSVIAWNGTVNSDWANGANWNGGTAPGAASGAVAIFGNAAANYSVNLQNTSEHVGTLSIDSGTNSGYTFTGAAGKLLVDNGTSGAATITVLSGNNTIAANVELDSDVTITNAGSLTISGNITSAGTNSATQGISILGAGKVTLTGANTYSGPTSIAAASTVVLGSGTASFGAGAVANAGIINLNTGSGNFTLGATITGAGTLTQDSTGVVTVTQNNTRTGPTLINAGTLVLGPAASIGTGALAVATKLDLGGNNLSTSSLTGAGIISSASGTPFVALNGGSTFAGSIQNGGGIVGLTLQSGTTTFTGTNTYTGDTTFNGGTAIIPTSTTLNPASKIVVNTIGAAIPISLADGVTLANTIVMNVTQASGVQQFVTVPANGSATMTGNLTTLTGLGNTPNDIPQAGVRFGTAGATSTLTLTGNINSGSTTNVAAGTSGLFSTVLILVQGNLNLNGATLNSGTSQFVLGRLNGATANITFNGTASISSNVGAGIEGGNMGGNGNTTTVNVVLNDSSAINVNTANFSVSGASTTPTSLTMNGTSSLTTGGFTRNGTGAATVTANGGSIIAAASNANFFPALANTTLVAGTGTGLNLNVGNFAVSMAQVISGSGNVNVLGTGTLTLTGNNTYGGTTSLASTVNVGNGGTSGSLGAGTVSNTGTLNFNRSDATSIANAITGTGALNVVAGNVTLTGQAGYSGPTTVATQLNFGGGVAHSTGTIAGAGNVQVAAGTSLTSNAVTINTLQIDGIHTLRANGTNVSTSVVNTLAIAGVPTAWTGKMEINNHVVIVNTANGTASKADVVTALKDQVKQGATGTANGITSATVLADTTHKATYVVDNALLGLTTTIEGVAVNSSSVIVEATYQGDANLDRKVNVTDLGVLATFYGQNVGAFGIVRGDFDGNGIVNVSDLGILATDYGLGTAPGSTFSLAADLAQFPTLAGAAAAVPEPASLAVLAVGAGALLTRRKRR